MAESCLESRLEYLRANQNADGGWGYVSGRQSWIEPTAYAMLALNGRPGASDALDRAWRLLRSWQREDGAWRPADGVDRASWATALAVTLHCVRQVHDDGLVRGVDWLVGTRGAEGSWFKRVLYLVRPNLFGHDPSVLGWPWLPGTGSWVEPTCHALIALRRASAPLARLGYPQLRQLRKRVRLGERMLLERRALDGGWNYGNRIVLGEEMPSYPETTGVALVGMRGRGSFDADQALAVAQRHYEATRSPLARCWLAIGLRNYGLSLPEEETSGDVPPRHVHLGALQALAAPDGNHVLLRTEGVA